jgi:hypothetical protein
MEQSAYTAQPVSGDTPSHGRFSSETIYSLNHTDAALTPPLIHQALEILSWSIRLETN